jgi:alpha-tubulin suppressor-like RCC1 family protein
VRTAPGDRTPLQGVTAVAAGGFHSLALLADGTARAWGDNSNGQLGDGTDIQHPAPVAVLSTGTLDVRAVAAGRDHSLDLHGDIVHTFIWGNHQDGLQGNPFPLPVSYSPSGQPIEADVDGGLAHSLVLTTAGHVFAWGANETGQLGTGQQDDSLTPIGVRDGSGVGQLGDIKAIAAGMRHNLALTAAGSVYAWGNNDHAQLGNGTTDTHTLPVLVRDAPGASPGVKLPSRSLGNVIAVAAGWGHSLALKADGTVWAWGENDGGQLGNGSTTSNSLPTQVRGPRGRRRAVLAEAFLTGIVAIAAGERFSVALRVDGTVWAWGANDEGQLGDGTLTDRHYPTAVVSDAQSPVARLAGVKGIAAGLRHVLAVGSSGTVWSWGTNQGGALGRATGVIDPVPDRVAGVDVHPTLGDIEVVAAGVGHGLALRSDGTAWGWGANAAGQVGDGTFDDRPTPVQVMRAETLPFIHPTVIGAGFVHSLAISWAEASVVRRERP